MAFLKSMFLFLSIFLVVLAFDKYSRGKISRPFATAIKVLLLSIVVHLFFSLPTIAAGVAYPGKSPHGVSYELALFVSCFVIFIQKIESYGGRYQAAISAVMAVMVCVVFVSGHEIFLWLFKVL
ncbi:hypothetical protein [Halomonas sp. A29]|uniref:hypothetical protein n=1 Tax=Halomonas sp. A29 TaxID=3102786 RepID=UPI00398B3D09